MDIKQNKQSQREGDWGIALVIWGSLAVLGLVGVILRCVVASGFTDSGRRYALQQLGGL